MYRKYSSENLKERHHLEELGMCKRIIVKWLLNWIHLAQKRDQLYALVNMAVKLWFL
jgi:hypothetical protein